MELCRIYFLLFWAFQLVYAQKTTDPNEGSLSCLKIQKLVEVEYHLYLFKVFFLILTTPFVGQWTLSIRL